MKISASNIAWESKDDENILRYMRENGFSGLEIAPTRIIPESPYDHIPQAVRIAKNLQDRYGLAVSSMQSIWYGITDRLFGPVEERAFLTAYTKKAIDFAEAVDCHNLVFGCPVNRTLPPNADPASAVSFFRELGDYAHAHHTVISMEPNPPVYHTNYINKTSDALDLIRTVKSEGFKLNLDVGAMIENNEDVSSLAGAEAFIHHVHISEPRLVPLQKRSLHRELAQFLRTVSYRNYVSVEVGRQSDINRLYQMLDYVSALFM